MKFSERVKATGLPLDEVVVIGSGLLEQLGMRDAQDIDLVVSEELFDQLAGNTAKYSKQVQHGEERLIRDNPPLEIWRSWGSGGVPNFNELYQNGQTLDDVRFVATKTLIEQKKIRNLQKDQDDITWLERYNKEYARGRD